MTDGFGTGDHRADRVSISAVWDETVQVLRGRSGAVASIALLAFVLPPAIQALARLLATRGSAAAALAGLALGLVVLLASVWGGLSILSLSSDPSVTPERAREAGARRTPAAFGLGLLMGVIAALLVAPLPVALARAGFNFTLYANNASPGTLPNLTPGLALFLIGYSLLLVVGLFWAGARLAPLYAVVLHERLGAGAFGRAWGLTRGMGGRLFAVELLFALVLLAAVNAAQESVFVTIRLVLGEGGRAVAAFLAALAVACASAALSAVAYVFLARLYAALTAREAARASAAGYPDRA